MGALTGLLLLLLATPARSQPQLVVQRGGAGAWRGSALCFSPDQRLLAVRYAGSLGIWRLADRALLVSLPLDPTRRAAYLSVSRDTDEPPAFSPDSHLLALARDGRVDLLDPATGAVRVTVSAADWLPATEEVTGPLAFSPDGRYLAGTVRRRVERRSDLQQASIVPAGAWWLAETGTGRIVRQGAFAALVESLSWSGARLTAKRSDGLAESFDPASGDLATERRDPPPEPDWRGPPVVSPDGRFRYTPYDLTPPPAGGIVAADDERPLALAFAPDSRRLASLTDHGTVVLHACPSLRPRLLLPGHGHAASPLLADDGSALAVAVGSSTLALWRRGQGAEPRVVACEAGQPLGLTPDASGMVVEEREPPKAGPESRPPRSRRLDLASGAVSDYHVSPGSLPLYPWLRQAFDRVACHADYRCQLTWTSGGQKRSLDLPIAGEDRWAQVLAVTADGGRVVVAGGQNYDHTTGRLFLVDLRAGRILWDQAPRADISDAALSADGRQLVTIGGMNDAEEFTWRDLLLFSMADGSLLNAAPLPRQAGDWSAGWGDVYYVARQARRSPRQFGEIAQRILAKLPLDPALLRPPPSVSVTTSADGDVQVRDTATGALRGTLLVSASFPPRRVQWLVHTPEGRWDASPEAERWVRFRVGDELRGPEAGAGQRVPGLLGELLWGPGP